MLKLPNLWNGLHGRDPLGDPEKQANKVRKANSLCILAFRDSIAHTAA